MKLKMKRKEAIIFAVMTLFAVVMIYPFYFMINTSFKFPHVANISSEHHKMDILQ